MSYTLALFLPQMEIILHGIITRKKENTCEHGAPYLVFVRRKINVHCHYHHHHCFWRHCEVPWEALWGALGSKILCILNHYLHSKLSEQVRDVWKPRTMENRAAWIGKHCFGIFQVKIQCCNRSLVCTQHILCQATTNIPGNDLRLGFPWK